MSTIRAFGGVDLQSSAGSSVPQGAYLGTKLGTRVQEFHYGRSI